MVVKTWLSWSTGKDSAWSLWILRQDPRFEVVGLLTAMSAGSGRVHIHRVPRSLVEAQAVSVGLPLHLVVLPDPCDNDTYETRMGNALELAHAHGVGALAFGDLFLEDIRAYRERTMRGSTIEPVFPLWGRDTTELAHEMIAGGLRAIVTCLDLARMDPIHAGRAFDRDFLAALPEGIDPCAERGEFHTFAWDGPMFSHLIPCQVGSTEVRDGLVVADVVPTSATR